MQAVVFGWLHQPKATRKQLYQALLQTGAAMSAQGFEARFSQQAAEFLRVMVEEATASVLEAVVEEPVLRRFNGVYLSDSTRLDGVPMPFKVATRLELQRGGVSWTLEDVNRHDNRSEVMNQPLPKGALHVGDLAFFDLERFAHWQAEGVEWLTRYKARTRLFHPDGEVFSLLDALRGRSTPVHLRVQVGNQKLLMWLVAQPVSPTVYRQRLRRLTERARRQQRSVSQLQKTLARWTIYLTSVPDLAFAQLHTLYRARWQIERLFKRWKSLGKLDTSTSTDPMRRSCEVYAKLLAVLVAHWFSLAVCWPLPTASRDAAFSLCQAIAPLLHLACFRFPAFLPLLHSLFLILLPSFSITRRKKAPNACDLWTLFDASA